MALRATASTTAATIQEKPSIVNWSVKGALTKRSQWDKKFESNCARFAEKIADSITTKIFSDIHARLSDPYKTLPTVKNPLEFSFAFDITNPENVSSIKDWARNSATLSPLNDWLKTFQNRTFDHQNVHGSYKMSRVVSEADIEYFLNKMNQIAKLVARAVEANLATFAKKSDNVGFKHKVEWLRKEESFTLTKSMDSRSGNRLYVNAWIDKR